MKIPLLVVAGPTASGKSDAAVELADKLVGEVVSADSMQIYKYMDIGTAKVDMETRQRVPHHMLDVVEPDAEFNLADYKELAEGVCKDIWQRGKLPIMAGGTGLYIRAVCENFPLEQLPHDQACRERLNDMWDNKGQDYMLNWLNKVDPTTASRVNDRRRIIRALEIYELTGRASAVIQQEARESSPFEPILYALALPRPVLYDKINARAELMVIQGLIGEYISLINKGYSPDCNAMMGLGYRHCRMHVEGKWSVSEMVEHLQRDTRRYAKRQLTWFRSMDMVHLDNANTRQAIERIFKNLQEKLARPAK